MYMHNFRQSEATWQALLNSPEAKVLGAAAERELLVELNDCRERMRLGLARPTENEWRTTAGLAEFQQRVRELASAEPRLDPQLTALKAVACRYQKIRASLAMANVRLVAHIAKRYHGRGIPYGDLIQEGVCALLVAIDRFEVANGTRLATYAIWWIRQGIQRTVAAGAYPVRLNPRQLQKLAQANLAPADLERGRSARVDSPGLGGSQTIERLLAATRPTLSLDAQPVRRRVGCRRLFHRSRGGNRGAGGRRQRTGGGPDRDARSAGTTGSEAAIRLKRWAAPFTRPGGSGSRCVEGAGSAAPGSSAAATSSCARGQRVS